MGQKNYKNVVVRPRLISFEEWLESTIQKDVEAYKKDFASPYVMMDRSMTPEQYEADKREKIKNDESYLRFEKRHYWNSGSHWFVFFDNGRIVKMPKKKYSESEQDFEARLDKIIAKVEKENTTEYGRFSATMQKVINKQLPSHNLLVYPTTYGIGLWAIYNFNFAEQASEIESVLNTNKIEYKTEYSDKMWVFRYKISKKEVNRLLLENLK